MMREEKNKNNGTNRQCNCRTSECPLQKECLNKNTFYQSKTHNGQEKIQIRSAERPLKED